MTDPNEVLEYKYYMRDDLPYEQKTKIVRVSGRPDKIVSIANEFRPETDIEITEDEYRQRLLVQATNQQRLLDYMKQERELRNIKKAQIQDAIHAKLVSGQPLSSEEADFMVYGKITL